MFCVERLLINFPGQKNETIVNQHFSKTLWYFLCWTIMLGIEK